MYVFTMPADKWNEKNPNKQAILQLILKHQRGVGELNKLRDYYEGKHKILDDEERENRLVCNHAKDISDTASGYFIGNSVTYKSADTDINKITLNYSGHEKQIAEVIARKAGKQVQMVPKINYPQGIQTPDYLINGARFDLKTPEGNGKNTLYGMVKSKKRQANNFVICADKTPLELNELIRQIEDIYLSKHTAFVDNIVLVKDMEIVKVYKRNK